MTCELTVPDCFGRMVLLEHSNWEKHKPRHPAIVPYHDELPTVLADPDLVIEQADGAWGFYRLGILRGRLAGYYLKVITEDFGVAGWKIKTAYDVTVPQPMGTILWMRAPR